MHYAVLLFAFLAAGPAQAYVGPGAAIGLIGYFFGFVGVVVAAVGLVLYFPIRLLLKRRKAARLQSPRDNGDGTA